ncbi:unnamed protein product [Caenorhabditis auriculariae]|uniref:Uncharacterized protein n=1 Tax=Caenorhabditis auriculariae TaxID=2777116 RepID=A0A8S1H1Q1_9PELO|nr:unnamed protein product [Caenorhabditis auriculariae]
MEENSLLSPEQKKALVKQYEDNQALYQIRFSFIFLRVASTFNPEGPASEPVRVLEAAEGYSCNLLPDYDMIISTYDHLIESAKEILKENLSQEDRRAFEIRLDQMLVRRDLTVVLQRLWNSNASRT